MQSLRSVFAQVYRGGGSSMGSRNFSSPPGSTSGSDGLAVRLLIHGTAAAMGYFMGPYITDHEPAREELRKEVIQKNSNS
ncbi:hypothetical protein CARUB_v10015023mg [Capsella rubella]|uniref:Uncharacterized protein n=1 Tax=Capsella rubella TaxID=81985 RepID=R0G8F1_9BRAS|nr:hypothetical protein CARUB_v10015023mg [Capsella rubella]